MLTHRLRRWPNLKLALGECFVFTVVRSAHTMQAIPQISGVTEPPGDPRGQGGAGGGGAQPL